MLGMTRRLRVWAYTTPVDMRKGFDSLFGLVRSALGRDPLAGDALLFVSRNRRLAKVLLWDGTGLCIYAKRMERARFAKLWGAGPTRSSTPTLASVTRSTTRSWPQATNTFSPQPA